MAPSHHAAPAHRAHVERTLPPPRHRWGLLGAVAAVTAVVVAVAWVVSAVVHLGDRYAIDHVAGAWMTLARELHHGQLYPALDSGDGMLGGTRNMPLAIGVLAGAARATGEYLVSGKLVSVAFTAVWAYTMVAIMRRRGVPLRWALVVGVSAIASYAMWYTSLSVRPDLLPACLQLWVVALLDDRRARRWTVAAAGVLAALAWLTKLSAVWALLAAVAYPVSRRRRRDALTLVGVFAAVALSLWLTFCALSDGRMLDNLMTLSASGIDGPLSIVKAGVRIVRVAVETAPLMVALTPVSLWVTWRAARGGQLDIWHYALVAVAAVSYGIFIDRGAYGNHLVDLLSVLLIVTATPEATLPWPPRSSLAATLALVTVAAVTFLGVASSELVATAHRATHRPYDRSAPLLSAGVIERVPSGDLRRELLTDAPYLYLGGDVRPPVQDAFMVRVLAEIRPATVDRLVADIEQRRYALVALIEPLDSGFYARTHFGPRVADELATHYRFARRLDGEPGMQTLFLYVPAS